ncbi:MAG: hypothetical protein KGI87_02585, partial [Burkholderiales bacterium]|nr:hypothetical protein [Burkholderiales bacterium]
AAGRLVGGASAVRVEGDDGSLSPAMRGPQREGPGARIDRSEPNAKISRGGAFPGRSTVCAP